MLRASSVAQLCPTLCDPMDYSPSGSSVQAIFQARILQWVAISSSKGSSRPRDQTDVSWISCIGRQILYTAPGGKPPFDIPFSRGSSRPRDRTLVSSIADRRFTIWATREALFWHYTPLNPILKLLPWEPSYLALIPTEDALWSVPSTVLPSQSNDFTLTMSQSIKYIFYWDVTPIYNGEGNGTPLQYSCLENSMDGGAW